jgi:tRNA threonylcarbamoyladenosine biosynthesis protein TsaB
MRILAIETSCTRGSAALVDNGRLIAVRAREQENAHAEGIPVLIDELMAEAAWRPSGLDRLAAGVGPGSFTGLRMGIAFLIGIAQGLDRPLVGVGSLRAMAAAAPPELAGLRCPLLDARRDELFVAAYGADGSEALAPCAVARSSALELLRARFGDALLLLGALPEVPPSPAGHRSPESDLPHAFWVARCAEHAPLDPGPVRPIYVREAVAELPCLPPNPLGQSPLARQPSR